MLYTPDIHTAPALPFAELPVFIPFIQKPEVRAPVLLHHSLMLPPTQMQRERCCNSAAAHREKVKLHLCLCTLYRADFVYASEQDQ